MQLTPLTRHVIPVTSSAPNRHTRTRIRVADACRDQGSPIATRTPPNTGFAKTRHTFATSLVRGKTDLVVVAELMGHSRLDTTRQYSLPTERDKADALNHLTTDH
jgi:integrase